ncbi:hypothetical protein PINS_up007140 [Pythium insidiosum]|nr:hypothetical protein PINS_up007140 [Pythium insidiosum]
MDREQAEARFLRWLCDHGASFPKVQWPVTTPNGLRGATALEPIATNEVILSIPRALMISEETCWSDPELGPVYDENRDVFTRDDPVLALFLTRELAKGDTSFYAPYLSILPEVVNVQDWTDDERAELRDRTLEDAAERRINEVATFYERIMHRLEPKYPGRFPRSSYSFARFRFAWKTIQARTFGRRLPWTALVPFADCLNHANVATKYDFDVDGNGMFRLYPSAGNAYAQGMEVFNSYGRRPNFQLLLDYGFALTDNEWDFVDVALPSDASRLLGKRFPFKRTIRLDRQTSLAALFPARLFSAENQSVRDGEVETRAEALTWFKSVLVSAFDAFDCSMDSDESDMNDETIPERTRVAIIYRRGRMQILMEHIRAIDSELREMALLDKTSHQLEELALNSTPQEVDL